MFSQNRTTGSFQIDRQVQRLGEDALVDRAVPEEGHRDPVGAIHLRGQRCADGDGDARADDGVLAQQADRRIGEVHRAALPLAAPGALAQQLGHRLPGIKALGDGVAVAAVGAGHVVVPPQSCHRGDRRPLLADAGVERAADLADSERTRWPVSSKRRMRSIGVVHTEQIRLWRAAWVNLSGIRDQVSGYRLCPSSFVFRPWSGNRRREKAEQLHRLRAIIDEGVAEGRRDRDDLAGTEPDRGFAQGQRAVARQDVHRLGLRRVPVPADQPAGRHPDAAHARQRVGGGGQHLFHLDIGEAGMGGPGDLLAIDNLDGRMSVFGHRGDSSDSVRTKPVLL